MNQKSNGHRGLVLHTVFLEPLSVPRTRAPGHICGVNRSTSNVYQDSSDPEARPRDDVHVKLDVRA